MEFVPPNVLHPTKIVSLMKFVNKESVRGFVVATNNVETVKFVSTECALKVVWVMLNVLALKSVTKINVEILVWTTHLVENVRHAKFSIMKCNVLVLLDLLETHSLAVSPTASGVPNPKLQHATDFQAFWPPKETEITQCAMLENFAPMVSA